MMNEHALQVLEFGKIKHLLASFAASALGKSVAEKMSPLTDREKISATIDQTTEMRDVIKSRGRFPVGGLRDIRPFLARMHEQGHPLEPLEFREIHDTLSAGADLRKFMLELGEGYPRLTSLARNIIEFPEICNQIDFCIDRRGEVRDESSERLAKIRGKIKELQSEIRSKVERIVSSRNLKPFLQQDLYSIRDGRCVLLVKTEQKYKVKGIIHDVSQTGSTVYIEPEALVELGNNLSDLLYEEKREVTRILWDISFKILQREEEVRRNLDALAWVDFTYAKAQFGNAYGMNAPVINDNGYLRLRDARHPLLIELELKKTPNIEEVKTRVIPLSAHVGDDFDILVITGPNTGGKTVALKTLGLLSAMALCGMHIPAHRGSEVPVFHDIFADIGDEQSLEQSLSTFSSHMANIVRILKGADDRSLVLIDEMGSGTDPAEGAALSTAILDRLYNLRARTVLTTHLGVLKSYAYSRPRAENASMEFDVKTLRPTYRMTIGIPGSSNAITIAKRLGMLPDVIGQAEKLMESEDTSATKLIAQMQESRMEMEKAREDIERLKEETEKLRNEFQQKVNEIGERRTMLTWEAEDQIDAAFRALREQIGSYLKPLKQMPKPASFHAEEVERIVGEALHATPLAIRRREWALGLKKGAFVYVRSLRARCMVKKVDKKREAVIVMMGNAEVTVPFDELSWVGQE
jgi:DNA mismatch repair protein MutS2